MTRTRVSDGTELHGGTLDHGSVLLEALELEREGLAWITRTLRGISDANGLEVDIIDLDRWRASGRGLGRPPDRGRLPKAVLSDIDGVCRCLFLGTKQVTNQQREWTRTRTRART